MHAKVISVSLKLFRTEVLSTLLTKTHDPPLSVGDKSQPQPTERPAAGSEVRRQKRRCCLCVGLVRASRIEAVPPTPDDCSTDHCQWEVVVRKRVTQKLAPLKKDRNDDRGNARTGVNAESASKVDSTQLC